MKTIGRLLRGAAGALLSVGCVVLGALPSAAQNTGTQEGLVIIGGAGSAGVVHPVEDTKSSNTLYSVGGFAGYFLTDEVALGLSPSLSGDFGGDTVLVGGVVQGEYNFWARQAFTPFVNAGIGALYVDAGKNDDTDGAFSVGGGARYFLSPGASVDLAIKYLAPFDGADEGIMSYLLGFSVYLNRD